MALQWIVVVAVSVVFCLTPLAVYFVWLASVYRRDRPTLLTGPVDFLALLAGLSGFVLLLGWVLLVVVQSDARLIGRGNWQQIQAVWGEERGAWALVAAGYLALVAGVVAWVVAGRSRLLAVYAIDGKRLEAIVTEVLAGVGVPANRLGNVWSDGRDVLAVEPSPGFDQANVKLLTRDARLGEEVARGLRQRLDGTLSESRNARWFASAATSCGMAVASSLGLLAYYAYLVRG